MVEKYGVDTIKLKIKLVETGMDNITTLSKISGIRRATLSNVISGKVSPSSDNMYRLVSTLKIKPEEVGDIFFAKQLT